MSLFSTRVDAPPPRDLARETSDTLETQIRLAPDVFAATASEEFGDPAYAQLQMDMAQQHAPQIRQMMADDLTAQRGADADDLARFGPQISEAWRAANPQQAALLDSLHGRAMDDLARGGALSPEEMRQAQQSARAAHDARGRVRSGGAATAEVLNRHLMQQQRQQQAMQQGMAVAGLQSGVMQDPSMAILGRPSMVNTGQHQFQPGMAFNPFDPYAAQLYGQNSANQMQANMASASMRAGLAGGLMSMGGALGGAHLGSYSR